MDPARLRYQHGHYEATSMDDAWKAAQMARLIAGIPDRDTIRTCADVGCGQGGLLLHLRNELLRRGFPLQQVTGYDVAPFPPGRRPPPGVAYKQADFLEETGAYDLVCLNDVLEHVTSPQVFLERVGARARYVALHLPLDDRLSLRTARDYERRLGPVGHISFFNPASALNLATAAGLLPLACRFTPGFSAPSGRVTLPQRLVLPLRAAAFLISPPLAARTVGGVSLALLCRGRA